MYVSTYIYTLHYLYINICTIQIKKKKKLKSVLYKVFSSLEVFSEKKKFIVEVFVYGIVVTNNKK